MRIKNLLVILLVFFCTNTYGRIYKCQNEYGRALYSNIPCENQQHPATGDLPPKEDTSTQTVQKPPKPKAASAPEDTPVMQATPENVVQQHALPKYPAVYQFSLDIKNFFKRLFKGQTAQASNYQCDGRTTCSQMTSCEEAIFFIQKCPDTEMDTDHDGIPCESQWCTNPL